jgi:hypothetical protein
LSWYVFSKNILLFKIRIFPIDINECLSSPCAKTIKCENTPGSYRCVEGCDPGYTWSLKQGECRGKIILFAIELFGFFLVQILMNVLFIVIIVHMVIDVKICLVHIGNKIF